MIDIEPEVLELINTALTGAGFTIPVRTSREAVPESFPCVYISEVDNYIPAQGAVDSRTFELYARITFQIDVYANGNTGRRREAKKILGVIDSALTQKGFRRTSLEPLPMANGTIFRYVNRYVAIVTEDKTIYRSV